MLVTENEIETANYHTFDHVRRISQQDLSFNKAIDPDEGEGSVVTLKLQNK